MFRDLESLGCREDVCRGGCFIRSGTEKFQGFTLPLERRGEVRALIGDRAERLAYVNCAMDRACLTGLERPRDHIRSATGSPGKRSRFPGRTSMTFVACISLIGWNRFRDRKSGTIGGPVIRRWHSDWVAKRNSDSSGFTAGVKSQ